MAELGDRTPLTEDVATANDELKERLRYADWSVDRAWPYYSSTSEEHGSRDFLLDKGDDVCDLTIHVRRLAATRGPLNALRTVIQSA